MPKLFVFTVNTHKDNLGLKNWENSCKIFGYNYKVLCQGENFGGWGWRTRQYMKAIEDFTSNDDDIVTLCDSNDVFFIGPADEFLQKFLSFNKRIVMGAEPACCNGIYHDESIRPIAWNAMKEQIPDSRYRYPNAGIVVGYRNDLLRLLDSNKDAPDDQGGYLEKRMKDPEVFALDYKEEIIGQFPRMTDWHKDPWDKKSLNELDWWTIDHERRRIKNVDWGTEPLVLHFAGSNWNAYNTIASLVFPFTLKPRKAEGPLQRIRIDTNTMLRLVGREENIVPPQATTTSIIVLPIALFAILLIVATGIGISYFVLRHKRQHETVQASF